MSIEGRFRLWCALLLLLAGGFAMQVSRGLHFETDILALLPDASPNATLNAAQANFAQRIARRVSLLVSAADDESAREAAAIIAEHMQASKAFATVQLAIDSDWAASARQLLPYRLGLLSDQHRAWLASGQTERLRDEALGALYTPAAFARLIPAAQDLAGLLSAFVLDPGRATGAATLDRGLLVVRDADRTWVLIAAETADSPFAADGQQQVSMALDAATLAARFQVPSLQLLRSGVVLHAADAAARAKSELSLFGTLSSLAVLLLVWLSFRSLHPLILSLLSLGIGMAAGLLACQWAFGSVHLITMVFGTTLIGVAVDYSLHFFSDQFRDPLNWNGRIGLGEVGGAILMGHLAAALGYATLLIPPFPGLRQMALFSIVGLMFSCGCVLCLYPRLAKATAGRHEPLVLKLARRLASSRFRFRATAAHIAAAALLAGFTVWGLFQLRFQDDIRLMQSSPPSLISEERQLREHLGVSPDSRFFLVIAPTAEVLLQREEALTAVLTGLREQHFVGGYLAVSQALPSIQRQTDNRRLQIALVYSSGGLVPMLMRQLGASENSIAAAIAAADPDAPFLTPKHWLETSVSGGSAVLRPLWLGMIGAEFASAVTLNGVKDATALASATAALDGVHLVDRVGEVSSVMSQYRRSAARLMTAVAAVVLVLLVFRYGLIDGALCLLPPIGGSLIALALLGAFGVAANLFNVLALLLLFGMGVDYAVFLREGRKTQVTVLLAVGLSALTTLFSFGLLALSSTPFIRAIGLTLAPGIALIFLLAIWLGPAQVAVAAESTR